MTERQHQLQNRQQQRYQSFQQQRYQQIYQSNRDIKFKTQFFNIHSSKIRFDDSNVYYADTIDKSYFMYEQKTKQYMIESYNALENEMFDN